MSVNKITKKIAYRTILTLGGFLPIPIREEIYKNGKMDTHISSDLAALASGIIQTGSAYLASKTGHELLAGGILIDGTLRMVGTCTGFFVKAMKDGVFYIRDDEAHIAGSPTVTLGLLGLAAYYKLFGK